MPTHPRLVGVGMKTYFRITDGYLTIYLESIDRAYAVLKRIRDAGIELKIQPIKMTEEQFNALPVK